MDLKFASTFTLDDKSMAFAKDAISTATRHDRAIIIPPVLIEPVGVVDFDWNGRRVKLPQFDPRDFPPSLRVLIPEEKEEYVDYDMIAAKVAAIMSVGEAPMLIGEPGTGKTYVAEYLASRMRVPFIRDQFDQSTPASRVLGKMTLVSYEGGTETRYQPSRFLRVISWPSVYLMDELNAADDEVRFLVRSALDGARSVTVEDWDGRTFVRHPYNYMMAAINPPSGRNTGVVQLAEADRDRWATVLVHYPPANREFAIVANMVKAKGLDVTPTQVNNLLAVIHQIRSLADKGEINVSAGVRTTMRFATLLAVGDVPFALEGTFGGADERDLSVIREAVDMQCLYRGSNIVAVDIKQQLNVIQKELVTRNEWLDITDVEEEVNQW